MFHTLFCTHLLQNIIVHNILFFINIRRNHPEVEKSDLDLGFEDLEQLTTVISEISGLPNPEEEETDSGNPPKIEELND